MEGLALVILVLIVLAVAYKLGLFNPIIDLTDVATRESKVYNREHKIKVAKRYLSKENTLTSEEVSKINESIKSIDNLQFD